MIFPNTTKGFTMMEVLLTVFVLGILTAISVPAYIRLNYTMESQTVVRSAVEMVRRAQSYAQANIQSDDWGVYVNDDSLVLFLGDDYSSRDTDFDEIIEIPPTTTVPSHDIDIIFEKESGLPDSSITFDVVDVYSRTTTISINEKGVVSY